MTVYRVTYFDKGKITYQYRTESRKEISQLMVFAENNFPSNVECIIESLENDGNFHELWNYNYNV